MDASQRVVRFSFARPAAALHGTPPPAVHEVQHDFAAKSANASVSAAAGTYYGDNGWAGEHVRCAAALPASLHSVKCVTRCRHGSALFTVSFADCVLCRYAGYCAGNVPNNNKPWPPPGGQYGVRVALNQPQVQDIIPLHCSCMMYGAHAQHPVIVLLHAVCVLHICASPAAAVVPAAH